MTAFVVRTSAFGDIDQWIPASWSGPNAMLSILALVALGVVAVFCVAIVNAGDLWTAVTLWLSIVSIVFSLLAVRYRQDHQRAFWLGFLYGAESYAALTFYAISGLDSENITRPALADHALISGQVASFAYSAIPESRRPPLNRGYLGVSFAAGVPRSFRYLFHFAFILVTGWICGLAGIRLYLMRRKSGQSPASVVRA